VLGEALDVAARWSGDVVSNWSKIFVPWSWPCWYKCSV
jgi:hypothetical protein